MINAVQHLPWFIACETVSPRQRCETRSICHCHVDQVYLARLYFSDIDFLLLMANVIGTTGVCV